MGERSLLSKSGKARLDKAEMPTHSARVLELREEMLEKAQEIEDELQKAIEEEAAGDGDCAILRSIPNVGAFTALLIPARVCLRDHRNSAKVAVARRAAEIIHHLLKKRECWEPSKKEERAEVAA